MLLEKIPPIPGNEFLLSNTIRNFFQAGLDFIDLVGSRQTWHANGNSLILLLTGIANNNSYKPILDDILNQIVSTSPGVGNSYASDQVEQYAKHTSDGYALGLNDNSGSIQFAIAFGLYLAKTAGL